MRQVAVHWLFQSTALFIARQLKIALPAACMPSCPQKYNSQVWRLLFKTLSLPVAWASALSAARKPTLLCCATVAAWVDCGSSALQKPRPSWLAAGLLLDAGSAFTKGGQVMFCPQPLHQLPSLGNRAHRDARKPTLLCCTNVAAWVDCGPRALQNGWLQDSCWMQAAP